MVEKEQESLIERYITGQMDTPERVSFEKRLKSDPILARKTSSYRNSFSNPFIKGGNKLRHGIMAVSEQSSKISKRIADLKHKKNLMKGIGLILIISIISLTLFFVLDKNPDYTALYNHYYKESILIHPLLQDNQLKEVPGITHYQNRDFERAIPALEKEIISVPGDAKLYLYLGLAYLETDVYDKAKLNFEKSEKLSEGKYRDAALWYLSLTQVKLKQIHEAKQHLVALINQNGESPYKIKAKLLLYEL